MNEEKTGTTPLEVLVVRPDRLGDVILSTPVLSVIKRHNPRTKLTLMVRAAHVPILQGLPSVDHILTYDPDGRHAGLKGLWLLYQELRSAHFRIAVVLQSEWRIAFALWLARVRHRVGPVSKPYSYLFYNRGLRQRRSQVEMHEADYNLQLLRRLGIRSSNRFLPTEIHVAQDARDLARRWLEEKGWRGGEPLVAIHPGMGGSALNWPEDHYLELIRLLLKDGVQVLVTGGTSEEALLHRFREGLGAQAEKVFFYGGREARGVDALAALFTFAQAVVAASTGPLHIAVALRKPVLSFYPPIRVQSAIRWGPYTQDEAMASVMVPEVYCGEDFHCRGNLCNYFPCMNSLTVSQARTRLRGLLEGAPT